MLQYFYMNKSKLPGAMRTVLGTVTVATGGLFGLDIISVPERYREHLPHMLDLASTAGNIVPSMGIGVLGMWFARKETQQNRFRAAMGVLAVGVAINVVAENHTANAFVQSLNVEPQYLLGDAHAGETRDIEHGIGGTVLGIAFSSLGRKREDEVSESDDTPALGD